MGPAVRAWLLDMARRELESSSDCRMSIDINAGYGERLQQLDIDDSLVTAAIAELEKEEG